MAASSAHKPKIGYEESGFTSQTANMILLGCFLLFVVTAIIIWLCIFFFKEAVVSEKEIKIGQVVNEELLDLRKREYAVLTGQEGVLANKNNISVDDAIEIFVQRYNKKP